MFSEAVFAVMVIIVGALIVTNPAGDKAVLGTGFSGLTGLTNSLQKGVK